MERQRVVHYARSRTAKVIRPGYTNYPAPTQAATLSELSQAPLASIDSDFVIVTKRRDETNMAPNLWSQINKNMPQTNFILQNVGENSQIFDTDDNFSEQSDYSSPRTYVKLRATQNYNLNNTCQKSQFYSPQCLPRAQFAKSNHKILNIVSNCNRHLSAQIYDAHSTHNSKATYQSNNSWAEQLITRGDHHSLPGRFSNKTNGYPHGSTKHTVETATIKENFLADSKIKPRVHSQDSSKATITSDHSSLNSQASLSSPLELGHSVAGTSSRIDSCSDRNFTDLGVTLSVASTGLHNADGTRTHDFPRAGFSHGNESHDRTESFEIAKLSQGSAAETTAVDCCKAGDDMLPEVSGISPSEYTSDIRLASERIAQMYSKHGPQARLSPRYCSVYVSGSPCSSDHSSNLKVKTDQEEPFILSDSLRDTRHVNTVNQSSPGHDIADVEQRNTHPTTCHNNVVRPSSAPCWKRSSLRQSTHKYMSISELTVSMEDLHMNSSQIHTSTNNSFSNSGLEIPNRLHSVNVTHSISSDYQQTRKFCEDTGNCDSSTEDSSSTNLFHVNNSQPPNGDVEFTRMKRMSYKLATSDSAYEFLNENQRYECTHSSNNKRTHINRSNSLSNDAGVRYVKIEHRADNTSGIEPGRQRETEVADKGLQQASIFETFDHEERLRSLKRRSFKLATSSLSDLTFLDDSVDSAFSVERNVSTTAELTPSGISAESGDSRVFSKPEVRHQPARDDSFSSGRLNSSFGSFYSCQSRDLPFSMDASSRKPQLNYVLNHKHSSTKSERPISRDAAGSESSYSGDSSAYYTASDTSYRIPDEDSGAAPYVNLLQPPFRMTMPAQRQKSSINRYQKMAQSKASLNSVSFKANTLPQNVKPPKYHSQPGVFRCYGCGVNDKFSSQTQHRGRKPSARLQSSRSRIWVNPDYVQGRQLDHRKRSRSAPASRRAPTRQPEASMRNAIPVKAQMYIDPDQSVSDMSCSISVSSPGPSATTFIDPSWQTLPRIPPSLGRPRRKLYAGFDSQPLPMDSFLSDSSSVYSTQSCSSWGTSRSATVESCSRTPDLLSKARSTSSIASSLITPTRPVTQDDVFDFFTYTDKRSSVYENKHNLYLSRENSYPEDCYKEAFYDMTYSKESLESFLSDGTTVNVEHDLSPEYSLDSEKTMLNAFSGSVDLQNNNRVAMGDVKQCKQKSQLDFVHNRSKTEMKSSASLENKKNQLKSLKCSLPDVAGKPKFLSKRKYFSTKDIFDLVMASDKNYKDTKGRSRSLERQAQKVCESILCLT
ncbi:hypothetical protein BsWGS_20064 [Bradybaena similaris]